MYNGEKYLSEAIDSVLAQTCAADEIIVINDGSTDQSETIAYSYHPKVKLLNQPHQGICAALNYGVQSSSHEWIAFLDADDLWVENKLELQIRATQDDPEIDVVMGHVAQFVSPELKAEEDVFFKAPKIPDPAYSKGTALIRREVFDRIGLFDPGIKMGEFIDWYLRAQEVGINFLTIQETILRRRWHHGNYTRRNDPSMRKDYARIIHKWRLSKGLTAANKPYIDG